jgi:hypothetical protein
MAISTKQASNAEIRRTATNRNPRILEKKAPIGIRAYKKDRSPELNAGN